MKHDAITLVERPDEVAELGTERPLERALHRSDDVHTERTSPQRGGDIEPDEAGGEHHRAARSASCLDDPPAVSERTEVVNR
jgi:hypothetical protein